MQLPHTRLAAHAAGALIQPPPFFLSKTSISHAQLRARVDLGTQDAGCGI